MKGWIARIATCALALVLTGCGSSIRHLGTVPQTTIDCYSIKDKDFFVAGILLMCTHEGHIQAASGGAAPGVAGFLGSVVQGAGTLGAGLAVGSGIKALESVNVQGQLVPPHVDVGGHVGVTGTLTTVPGRP